MADFLGVFTCHWPHRSWPLTIFTFLFSWNDLLGPLIYLPADLNQTTLTVGLACFKLNMAVNGL